MVKKYEPKPPVIEAVYYQYPASQELKSWLGDDYRGERKARSPSAIGEIILHYINSKEETAFREGNYIMKYPSGNGYSAMSKYEFEQMYQEKE